ncbi:MAG: cytidylate kinase-like family protein [Clostridia bacterium]|nr:cytidylate kinase-like family protein [Clostridia bacterium]MBR5045002.1 cytidylate kinase-like family protein [Clostridia bacterium]
MADKIVITIARQYGSGGREIGEKVAKALGIKHYDENLITLAAREGNLDETVASKADESAANSLLYTLALGSNFFGSAMNFGYKPPLNDKLFLLQSDVIRRAAEEGSCVIIGRCADYVLRDHPKRLSVFVYGDLPHRKARVMERHEGLTEAQAIDLINKTDRRRSSYYNFYTGNKWGKYDNYHLAVNSSLLGIDKTAEMIADAAKLLMNKE